MAYNKREFPVRYQPSAGGLQSFELDLDAVNDKVAHEVEAAR
jgi:hypothetical protein